MARYTSGILASLRHGVEDTDTSLPRIAAEHEISLRTLYRVIVREEWKRRSDRPPRDLPPTLALLNEATALLAEQDGAAADGGGQGAEADAEAQTGRLPVGAGLKPAPTMPQHRHTAPAPPSPDAQADDRPSRIARVERLVEQHLAAEEAARVQLDTLPGARAEAERAARTLASLTKTLHVLQRLRGRAAPDPGSDHDDDMPRDPDEFRLDLARRIEAWAASRTGPGHAAGDSGAAPVDAVR